MIAVGGTTVGFSPPTEAGAVLGLRGSSVGESSMATGEEVVFTGARVGAMVGTGVGAMVGVTHSMRPCLREGGGDWVG